MLIVVAISVVVDSTASVIADVDEEEEEDRYTEAGTNFFVTVGKSKSVFLLTLMSTRSVLLLLELRKNSILLN